MRRTAHTLLLLALALLPWAWFPPFPWIHAHAQWSDVFVAGAFAAWLTVPGRLEAFRRHRRVWVAVATYLLAAAASLAAQPSGAGALKLLGIASLVATMVLVADLASSERGRRQALTVVACSAVAVCAVAWLAVILSAWGRATPLLGTFGDLVPGAYVRVQATLRHPNLLASFLIFAWTAAAARATGRWRALTLTAIAVTVPLTLSRGLLSFLVAILWGRSDSRGRRIVAGLCTAATLVTLMALTAWRVELDPTRFSEARLVDAPSVRRAALTTALSSIAAEPWLGCGPNCLPAIVGGLPFDAHCTPVNIAATLGLPALGAFVGLVTFLWRVRPRPTDRILWAGLAALLLDGFTQDIEDFRHLWVLLGLLAAVRSTTTGGTVPGRSSPSRGETAPNGSLSPPLATG